MKERNKYRSLKGHGTNVRHLKLVEIYPQSASYLLKYPAPNLSSQGREAIFTVMTDPDDIKASVAKGSKSTDFRPLILWNNLLDVQTVVLNSQKIIVDEFVRVEFEFYCSMPNQHGTITHTVENVRIIGVDSLDLLIHLALEVNQVNGAIRMKHQFHPRFSLENTRCIL